MVAVAFLSACSRQAPQADLHPIANQNVLLITIDTLRADALGCYGGPAATPALDRLAAEGVRFDFAHAHAVITLTLARQHPHRHLSVSARHPRQQRLPAAARRADGGDAAEAGRAIETAAFVGAFPLHSRFGLNQGFDRLRRSLRRDARADRVRHAGDGRRRQVVALARDWIAEAVGQAGQVAAGRGRGGAATPWFVWVHLFDPHAPYRPPPPFDAQYAGRPYYGEVAATDAALAPLLDDLRAAARPTLVIVTGDHGEGARRSRRAVARPVRVRVDAAGSADRRGDRWSGSTGRQSVVVSGPEPSRRVGKSRRSPRGTSTSCRRSSTRSGSRRRAICLGARCCRRPSGAPARRRGRRTSRRWARCSIAAGRR